MKRFIPIIFLFSLLISCTEETGDAPAVYTGNETQYPLYQASNFPISGMVTFKERIDGFTDIEVILSGTNGDVYHPVHLHYGDISNEDADIAQLLSPLLGKSGSSVTTIDKLADESAITYKQLVIMDASIKIHLDNGVGYDVILAGGNVGKNTTAIPPNGRTAIAVCKNY